MMTRNYALIALLALAACGSNEQSTTLGDTTYTYDEKGGTATVSNERGTISVAEGAAAAQTNMPDYAPQYPGSTITSVMNSEREGVKRTTVLLATSDTPTEVVEFYRERFTAHGLPVKSNFSVDDSAMIAAEDDAQKVSITASREDQETTVGVMYSAK